MATEQALAHRALEEIWGRVFGAFEGARFERRSDLIVARCPPFPIPQCNGPWVVHDSQAAVDALPAAIAEVEATGVQAWLQTRTGHERTRQVARELGLTHTETIPGMVVRPGELGPARSDLEISRIDDDDIDEANALLAVSFEAPKTLFDELGVGLRRVEGCAWYVGRVADAIVSTAVGVTAAGATGIFDVATPPEHRGKGYGSALTARAVRDGFDLGSELAFLQSSDVAHGAYRRLGFRDVEEYTLLTRP